MRFRSPYVSIVFGFMSALVPAITATYAIPKFEQLFKGFGAELPWFTKMVISAYGALWLLPIMCLILLLAGPNTVASKRLAFLVGTIGGALAMLMIVFAMYQPIFQLGSVV